MTDAAVFLRGNVVHALGCRNSGRVARSAVVRIDIHVIVGNTREGREVAGRMTHRTIAAGRDVVQRFTQSDFAVMTQRAVIGIDTGVREYDIGEADRVVTIGAILAVGIGRYVIEELAHTDDVVVAAVTARRHAGMIVGARAEGTRCMTGLAVLGTDRHVFIERCGQRYSGRIDTVVTVVASLRQDGRIGVVYAKCRYEALGVMARAAISSRGLMGRRIRRRHGINAGCSIVT